jgi:serine phosphatase RsbU (regulator of sigma subunit)
MTVFPKIFLLTLALILPGILPARALESGPVIINDNFTSREIGRQVEYLEDRGKALTIDAVSKQFLDWKKHDSDSFSQGFTGSAYWFRFHVINNQKEPRSCYLEINYPMLDRVDLYSPAGGNAFTLVSEGDHYPFYQRKIIDRNFIFELKPIPRMNTYYLRVSTTSSLNFSPILWSHYSFSLRNNTEQPVMFMYYGLMLVMVIYNLFIFLSVRKITYILYSASILSFMTFQLVLNGYAFQYLWPNSLWWANNCLPFFMGITCVLTTIFLLAHINARSNFPVTYRIIMFSVTVPSLALSIASLLVDYRIAIFMQTGLTGYTAAALYIMGIYAVIKRSRAGYYVTIGYTALAVGVLSYVAKTFGILPANFFTSWSMQMGSAMVVIFFSLSLADELNQAKEELLDLNVNLEKKVNERTKELKEVMGVLESINDNMLASNIELEEANTRYVKDMDMAASVQTAFLPKEPPVSDEYDIAFLFRPMSTVSGDFLDFYMTGGRLEGVGIFDVSGHGISSGLMTLLARSAIEKHFTDLKHEKLGSVMDAINNDFIREMGDSGLYLTGILLRFTNNFFEYCNSGNPELLLKQCGSAGAMVVRHDNGSNMGPLLGIEILQESFNTMTHPFVRDDCLLLYTDCLNETRNDNNEQYGELRIIESFSDAPDGPARDMLDHIMRRFYSFTGKKDALKDDITVILIRKR